MRARAIVTAALTTSATLVALTAAAGPAAALWVRPAHAPLTNAAGATNGCVADAEPMVVGWYGGPSPSVLLSSSLRCPAAADVHKHTVAMSLEQVLPDGSVRVLYSHGEVGRAQTSEPFTGPGGASTTISCATLGGRGSYSLVERWLLKTKTSTSDTAPYVAKVDRRETVTCPR